MSVIDRESIPFYSTFYHEHVLVKEPGTAARTPWHHDQSYYPVDGDDLCSLWIPVDPVREGRRSKVILRPKMNQR